MQISKPTTNHEHTAKRPYLHPGIRMLTAVIILMVWGGCWRLPEWAGIWLHLRFGCAATLRAEESTPKKPPPNIVLIIADDLGYGDLGCYGCNDIHTPNIDELAQEGLRFTDFYAAPVCSPTRACILTGCAPLRCGVPSYLLIHKDFKPNMTPGQYNHPGLDAKRFTSFAKIISKTGYTSILIGKWHLGWHDGYRPLDHGFDHFFGLLSGMFDYYTHCTSAASPAVYKHNIVIQHEWKGRTTIHGRSLILHDLWDDNREASAAGEYATDLFTRKALGFIEQAKQPFFLQLAYTAPHTPLQAPKEYINKYTSIKDNKRRTYAAMVDCMDVGIGKIIRLLRARNLRKNTLVIFVSDNGGDTRHGASNGIFRGRKAQMWEGGIRVPMIASWPGKIPMGKSTNSVGRCLDLLPTLLKVCGSSLPESADFYDGIDLSQTLFSGKPSRKRVMCWDTNHGYKAIRFGRWKLIFHQSFDGWKLFNLSTDPGEQIDLAARYPRMVASLKAKYKRYSQRPCRDKP